MIKITKMFIVNSAYKELPVIQSRFSFLNLYPSLFYVKMDKADPVTGNYRLEGTDFPVSMFISQCKFSPLRGNPLLLKLLHCCDIIL